MPRVVDLGPELQTQLFGGCKLSCWVCWLKQDTLISLMTIKFNSNNDCYDSCFSESLLSTCIKATTLAVKPRQSESPDAEDEVELEDEQI